MKLSIVTISYNQAEFLEKALCSVIEQSGPDVEYIVVDAGSTDGSRDIIERYRGNIDHIIFENDAGPADGLNKGFNCATGDWFGYLNSDDFYLADGLERARHFIGRHSEAGAIVGAGVVVDARANIIKRSISTPYSLSHAIHGAAFSLQQATFYRREAINSVGGFNTENRTCWDCEILVEMLKKGFAIERIWSDIGAFRIHSQSITGSGRLSEEYLRDMDRIFYEATGRYRSVVDRKIIAKVLNYHSLIFDPRRSLALAYDRIFGRRDCAA